MDGQLNNQEININKNNQPSTPVVSNKVVGFKSLKLILIGGVVVVVIFTSALIIYFNHKNNTSSPKTIQKSPVVVKANNSQLSVSQINSLLHTQAKLIFPNVSKMTPIEAKDIPVNLQVLVLNNAAPGDYRTIAYQQKQTGFYAGYAINNATSADVLKQIAAQATGAKWQTISNFDSGSFTLLELEKTDSSTMVWPPAQNISGANSCSWAPCGSTMPGPSSRIA